MGGYLQPESRNPKSKEESFAEAFSANRNTAMNAIAVFLKYLDKLVTAVSCNTYQVE